MLVPTKDAVKRNLKAALRDLPRRWDNKYDRSARQSLIHLLFQSLVGHNDDYLRELFHNNIPNDGEWILRDSQGAVEGAEYTEAARGKPCGHILRGGEATYRCKTCTNDDTCVLCSRCFEASDHRGHTVSVSISPGNSGCCDCGDAEAWKVPVHCAIHSAHHTHETGKKFEMSQLPQDLVESISATIGAALDYFCDVMSCAPEQLREPKTEESVVEDEQQARLLDSAYDGPEELEENPEYALMLWNDEKHAVHEVQEQVARACRRSKAFGLERANETDEIGRSFVMRSRDIADLLKKARIIEQIKITVTIRSARDTFREEMCSTIIEWLLDIAGCYVGENNDILTRTICNEMLQPWEKGSQGSNAGIGRAGIYDHEIEEAAAERAILRHAPVRDIAMNADGGLTITVGRAPEVAEPENQAEDQEDEAQDRQVEGQDAMDVDQESIAGSDVNMPGGEVSDALRGEPEDSLENSEATFAGYPPPPPPPPVNATRGAGDPEFSADSGILTPSETTTSTAVANIPIPQTPFSHARPRHRKDAQWHWQQDPAHQNEFVTLAEDIHQEVRLDLMILYDLRLWKKARVDLRDLYIGTMVKLPDFKRILGLRFAGLYTLMAQLYLIADREPDHSIIYLSLQMLTTPSITREVVERCNFLTTLLAVLYTFLTTRQVGRPKDVAPNATLAFDAGSVTNRRLYHFFNDMKHLFQNEYVREQLREQPRYILQFLDVIKLPQGICPNARAVGEHVEYETDAWISASILTREVNKLCRQFSEAFKLTSPDQRDDVRMAIRTVASATIQHCLGLEKDRFTQAEIGSFVKYKHLNPLDWDIEPTKLLPIVEFNVGGIAGEQLSFHHAMHYTLSWLIDGAKCLSADELRQLLSFTGPELNNPKLKGSLATLHPEDYLMALFDYPLRVCAWLAQMKANMWVRNGLSLRHQMGQYRGVNQRNLAHQHDMYLLQVAMVVCEPNRVLLSIVDRFCMADWMRARFTMTPSVEGAQMIDVAEDFVHLLIALLSERTMLQPLNSEEEQQAISIRRELTHVLCFKPLSYSDLCQKLIDRFQDLDEFQEILEDMTNYKAPEGLSDTGTFELKQEHLANLDPYIAHYTKNQRDEAETIYRRWVSQLTGKPLSEVIFEPHMREITSGLFVNLGKFASQTIFAQIVQQCLLFALQSEQHAPNVPITRVESFLQVVLHLVLLAVNEDPSHEDDMSDDIANSFVNRLLTRNKTSNAVFSLLYSLQDRKDFEACHAKIKVILARMQLKRPKLFETAHIARGSPVEQHQSNEALGSSNIDLEKKKKAESQARAKRALASMQKQQADFLNNSQNFDWGSDIDDDDSISAPAEEPVQMWDYPSGNCIYCQEECADDRLYGTFALLKNSEIVRTTNTRDPDYVKEVLETPDSFDRPSDSIRPFGLAGKNRDFVRKLNAVGEEVQIERQNLGKGFQPGPYMTRRGPVSSSCGHIMHYNCFESYNNATIRRQTHQIARRHPERITKMEFVCPLCKALGNCFLPIIWRGKEKRYPGILHSDEAFENWVADGIKSAITKYGKTRSLFSYTENESPNGPVRANLKDFEPSEDMVGGGQDTTDDIASMPPRPYLQAQHHLRDLPGQFPDDIYSTSPPLETAQSSASGKAMVNVYYRMRDTIWKNQLESAFPQPKTTNTSEPLSNSDSLARALGSSIAAIEIAQRGVSAESTGIFVEKISSITMTHLRILSDMITSYTSAGASQGAESKIALEIRSIMHKEVQQLFRGHPQLFSSPPSYADTDPALTEDPFSLLAECTLYMIPKLKVSYHHLIRICYLLEVVKGVHAVWRDAVDGFTPHIDSLDYADIVSRFSDQVIAFRQFLHWSGLSDMMPNELSSEQIDKICAYGIKRIRPNLTVFLRKVAILVNVTRGVDFSGADFFDPTTPELARLSHALKLPTVADMLRGAGTSQGESTIYLQSIVKGWIEHAYCGLKAIIISQPESIRRAWPTHPVIYELVGLPRYYDTLLDEMIRRKCPTKKNKDMMDPAVCLFCGEMMCSQSVCCTVNNQGGCNRHMAKCGKDVGLFLHLRKCMVLYLHDGSGSWAQCPYLDRHGETDPGLRRNRQLMLSQKRYDALLRDVWLRHMIPTTISRKLEADINNGGWETL